MKKTIITAFTGLATLIVAAPAFADGGASANEYIGWVAMASAICMALGTFGGAFGQARTASAALEGIARNPQAAPKVQTPMIIALAMTESLVLFSFVIAFFLQGMVAG